MVEDDIADRATLGPAESGVELEVRLAEALLQTEAESLDDLFQSGRGTFQFDEAAEGQGVEGDGDSPQPPGFADLLIALDRSEAQGLQEPASAVEVVEGDLDLLADLKAGVGLRNLHRECDPLGPPQAEKYATGTEGALGVIEDQVILEDPVAIAGSQGLEARPDRAEVVYRELDLDLAGHRSHCSRSGRSRHVFSRRLPAEGTPSPV